MNLELSQDQQMLKDMVDRFTADRYAFEARQTILHSDAGWSREIWGALAELGVLMIPVAEQNGGMGGGGVELMVVGEAFGRALVGEPWLPTWLCATVIHAASDALRDELLPGLMSGSMIFALADAAGFQTRDGVVSGAATLVLGGGVADRLLISANGLDGARRILLVDAAGEGVDRSDYALHGGGRAAEIRLRNAPVLAELASGQAADRTLRKARAVGVAAIAADTLGAAQAAFDLTIDYLKTRVQFSQPIGRNQALQHRAAEMFVELEQLRSAAIFAACALNEDDDEEAERTSAAVRIVTAKSARFIGQQCVQLHGGIGVTDEASIGHYFLRLTTACLLFDDIDDNITRLADADGYVTAAPYWETA